ncbi:lipocalin family protein [Corallibacter sp.]|uniref:lipocalin family protein n=1 Tax=Corallibacter sp. TaxID=2038084 RepID=UPI003AB734A8
MKNTRIIFYSTLLVTSLFISSCSSDDFQEQRTEPTTTLLDLLKGTWEESNVTHDGVDSETQIICNNEREQYIFNEDNSFTERYFDDFCNEDFDNGQFILSESSLTLNFDDSSTDIYQIEELSETILKISFDDGGVLVEETYVKID